MNVEYHPYPLSIRVNGWVFDRVWLIIHRYQATTKYGIAIEDTTFGRFQLTTNMIIEQKIEGRWYQTRPSILVESILDTTQKKKKGAEPL